MATACTPAGQQERARAGGELGEAEPYDEELLEEEEEGEGGGEEEGAEASGEDDPEFDMQQFGIYQALPVPPGQPDWEGEPQTAEEYLQRVR